MLDYSRGKNYLLRFVIIAVSAFLLLHIPLSAIADADGDVDVEAPIAVPEPPPLLDGPPLFTIPKTDGISADEPLFDASQTLDKNSLVMQLGISLARPELEGVRVGLHVVDLKTGKPLIAVNASERFNPASNQKLITTATALLELGPAYTFETQFKAEAKIDTNGTLKGDLYIVGGGDPWLVVEQVYAMAAKLYTFGLRRIEGDIVVDDTFFDDVRNGPGWEQDDTDNSYQAPMGALSVNFNSVAVYVLPGEIGKPPVVSVLPFSRYLIIENNAITQDKRRTHIITHTPFENDHNKVTIEGHIHPKASRRVFYHKIDNPPLFSGWAIHDAMKQLGIRCTGYIKQRPTPETAETLAVFKSPQLSQIVTLINKHSNNHMTEQVLKTLGASAYEPPGTWEKGVTVLKTFIRERLQYPDERYEIKNGSGLGDVNQIPPELLTRLLGYMKTQDAVWPEYQYSLSVAGRDGTLRKIYEDIEQVPLFRAKTGSLEQVIAVSGYLKTVGDQELAVSLIFNECLGHDRNRLKDIHREIIQILAQYDPNSSPPPLVEQGETK